MSTGLCVEGAGDCAWVEPLVSILFKAPALGVLMGEGVLPFGIEGVKKICLCTKIPCMCAFTEFHFVKRQSHSPDTVAALL